MTVQPPDNPVEGYLADEFFYQLTSYGRASYGGIEFTLEYPPDPRPRCLVCQGLVLDHQPVILLREGKAVYRLCNGALVCPDNLVLDGEDDTFFWRGWTPPQTNIQD